MRTNAKAAALAGLVLVLALPLAAAPFAAPAAERPLDKVLGRLGLEQAKIEELRSLYSKTAERSAPLAADLRIQEAELAKALLPKNPDKAAYERIVKRMAELQVQLRLVRIEAEVRAREIAGDAAWLALRKGLRGGKAESMKEKFLELRRGGAWGGAAPGPRWTRPRP